MTSNLRLRILSAVVMAAVALGATWIGGWPFRLLAVAAGLAIFAEWTTICGIASRRVALLVYLVLVGIPLLLVLIGMPAGVVLLALLSMFLLGLAIPGPAGQSRWGAGGILYVVLPVVSMSMVRGDGMPGLVGILFLFAVVWGTDIFAYFVGRAVGANHRPAFFRAIKLTTLWSFICAGVTTILFLVFGDWVIAMLTTVTEVRDLASIYLPWAALTALTGALAFEMDGVFIGATWSRDMRNMMLIVLPLFIAAAHFLGQAFGNHGLWAALNIFLAGRGFFLLIVLPRRSRETFGDYYSGSERPA